MEQLVCPVKSEFFKDVEQNFKMIVLFACNNVYHLVKLPVVVAADCRSYILRDVYGSSVFSKKYLFVRVLVFSLSYNIRYVNAHGTVVCFEENAFFKSFKDFVLAFKVCFAFKVEFVERNSCTCIRFFYAVKRPVIHFLPQCADFGISLFPFNKHFFRLFSGFRVFL